jgi:integrase
MWFGVLLLEPTGRLRSLSASTPHASGERAAALRHRAGRAPRNKGQLYPADPPTVEEIIAVMRQTPDDRHGARLRALIVVLWRGGLRVQEALALGERDLDPRQPGMVAGDRRRPAASSTAETVMGSPPNRTADRARRSTLPVV